MLTFRRGLFLFVLQGLSEPLIADQVTDLRFSKTRNNNNYLRVLGVISINTLHFIMGGFDNTKKQLQEGGNIVTESFKLGFMTCIESIEDKGHSELAKILRREHSKI